MEKNTIQFQNTGTLTLKFNQDAFAILARNLSKQLDVDVTLKTTTGQEKRMSVKITDIVMPDQIRYEEEVFLGQSSITFFLKKAQSDISENSSVYRSLVKFALDKIKSKIWLMYGTLNDEQKNKICIVHIPEFETFYTFSSTKIKSTDELFSLLDEMFKDTPLERK